MKNIEIENKYLISKNRGKQFLKSLQKCQKKSIEQAYIKYTKNGIKRVRKIDDRYILTVKKGDGRIREEFEEDISEKRYKKLLKKRIGYLIKKDRYIFLLDGAKYELDIFKNRFKKLSFLEIEFEDKDKMLSFQLPKILQDLIIKDVSDNPNYTNATLALKKYQINADKYFLKIDNKKKIVKIKKDIAIGTFLSIKLYLYLKSAEDFRKKYFLSKEDEHLHQFRVNLRKIRSLLQIHKELFEKRVYKKLKNSLKDIASSTNKKRDLDVFMDSLSKSDTSKLEAFLSYLYKQKESEDKKIYEKLNSWHFQTFIFDMEQFLKHIHFYTNNLAKLPAKKEARKSIKKMKKEIKNILAKLSNNSDMNTLHNLRIKFKKLRYLIECYEELLKKKKVKKMRKIAVKYQNSLGKINDLNSEIEVCRHYISQSSEQDRSEVQTLLENLQKELSRTLAIL